MEKDKKICLWCNKSMGQKIKNDWEKRRLHKRCNKEKDTHDYLERMMQELIIKQKKNEERDAEAERLRCEKIREERALRLAKYKIL
jgi:hypothetical protein